MIGALWSNSNYDDDKGTRRQAIEDIEENFDEAVHKILFGFDEAEEEIDKDNPFFKKAVEGLKKIEAPRMDEGATVKDVVEDYSKHIDQN